MGAAGVAVVDCIGNPGKIFAGSVNGVDEGFRVGVGIGLSASALMLVTTWFLYMAQPVGKVIVLTICPAAFTSIKTAPVLVKFQGWFSINWWVGVPKSPSQSPLGNRSFAPKYDV